MEPVDRVQEEERPHSMVEVVARATEGVEFLALGQQSVARPAGTDRFERRIPSCRRVGLDDGNQFADHREGNPLLG
jgi:hypothetical protein